MTRRIVLDTDIGTDVDDALALALALASPELELVAVTTVSGDTSLRACIAARLLALAGRADVPVHAGCEQPLAAGGGFAQGGHEGEGILDGGPDDFSAQPAVDALLRLFRQGDGLELVAIGPLTNIAVALERDPSLARRVARLTLMGGWMRAVTIEGRSLPPSIDYNLCSDEVASRRVLSSGIPIRLVTPDVTVQVWLTGDDVAGLERGTSPLQPALGRAMRVWVPRQQHLFAGLGTPLAPDMAAFLHDPLTLACAYDESFCRIEELPIEPVTVNGVFRALERPPGTRGTFPMRCATAVDAARFTAHVRRRLGLAS